MANIFNLPDFMFLNVDSSSMSRFNKLAFLLKGIIISIIHKRTKGKIFCTFMNLLYSNDGKIFFQSGKYYKKNLDGTLMYFPNKRIDRVIVNKDSQLKDLLNQYSLENFELKGKDLVVDCGSNVGELFLGLKLKNKNFKYIGFEPDPDAFDCLEMNLSNFDVKVHNIALSNKNGLVEFYLDTFGANSSIDYFGEEKNILVESKTLDSFNLDKVKLLKLEAEGHELEILEGAEKTILLTEFISVDYGPEKGKDGKMTLPSVTNFLFSKNFVIESSSSSRYTAVFRNLRYV